MSNRLYDLWLNSDLIKDYDKKILQSYTNEQIESYFGEDKLTFGTAGIRAIMNPGTKLLNEFTYAQISHGYAKFLLSKYQNPKIIIAHDNRRNYDLFSRVCATVMTSLGIKVFFTNNNQLIATPIVSYLIRKYKFDGAVIITASHNPKNYNGFKAYNSYGCQICDEDARTIESLMPGNETILENTYSLNPKLINYLTREEINQYYIDATKSLILTDINERKNFPIVFTAHHGTACYDFVNFLKKQCNYSNVISVLEQCYPDEDFPNSDCSNPEDQISFKKAIEYANISNARVLLGVDPDADRLAVVIKDKENNWKFMSGNEMGILYAYHTINHKKNLVNPFIVSTFVSTNLIDRIAKKHNINLYKTGTGFKFLGNIVNEHCNNNEELVVAFEEAIGSLNSDLNRDKDSYQAAAFALEIIDYYRKQDMDLNEVLENIIYPKYGYWQGASVSYVIPGLDWVEKSKKIMDTIENINIDKLCDKKLISKSWNDIASCYEWYFEDDITVRFRKSGTEPKFKAYFNVYGENLFKAKELLREIQEKVNEIICLN